MLTREHLWPAALHRLVLKESPSGTNEYWVGRLNQTFSSEPTSRDVCSTCNNGPLSKLDDYAVALFEQQLSLRLERNQKVDFHFDYHLLKRWLLKTCYNSARINQSIDAFAFKPLLPYILHGIHKIGSSVQLFVQLSYPGNIPPNVIPDVPPEDVPTIFYPTLNRLGHAVMVRPTGEKRILRAVHLYAYTFMLALFDPSEGSRTREILVPEVLDTFPGTTLLRPSRGVESLVCNGKDAWKSFSSSRDYTLATNLKT